VFLLQFGWFGPWTAGGRGAQRCASAMAGKGIAALCAAGLLPGLFVVRLASLESQRLGCARCALGTRAHARDFNPSASGPWVSRMKEKRPHCSLTNSAERGGRASIDP